MHVDLMRESATTFPSLDNRLAISSLRVWYCKYKSLKALENFENLETLVIAGFPDADLRFLAELGKLTYLRILHLPKIKSLSGLDKMAHVEALSLASSPAWDAAGKVVQVDSLAPIAVMPALRHLELFGVCNPTRSLRELIACKTLQTARFSQYPQPEVEHFYEATKVGDDYLPQLPLANLAA